MKCEFSETQFAYGILHEFENRLAHAGKIFQGPFFPTLREENELGYDAAITGPVRSVFFQFKVPEKKTTANAKYWELMGGPYYEFQIWPAAKSPQHNTLRDFANLKPQNKVYYCAPRFHTHDEYIDNHNKQTITKNSAYFPCGGLKPIKGWDAHSICYTKDPMSRSYMHSEPREIKRFDMAALEADIEDAPTYQSAQECLFSVAESFSIDVKYQDNIYNMYTEISNYLIANENLAFVLIGE